MKHDLLDFLKGASDSINSEYERIRNRAAEDPGTAGDAGEENWAELLRGWLPNQFKIVTKGRILSHTGTASPQVDILVLKPEYPQILTNKKLYLAAGVLAAFECKLTLKSKHIKEFFENSVKIKSSTLRKTGSPYNELQADIIYGLLAHSHIFGNKKKNAQKTIDQYIIKADKLTIRHPYLSPDIICIADIANWANHKYPCFGPPYFQEPVGTGGNCKTIYVCSEMIGADFKFTAVGNFLISLFEKLAYQIKSLIPLVKYFSISNVQGPGSGTLRGYEKDIFSSEVHSKILRGKLSDSDYDEWAFNFR